ncbi:HAD family hydrolase [Nocardia cyriacigeorgica]|uniref:HAD family hydrolase n=1 Tax=Nocardia cyriacigeorgica TaxID=135487 RepID=UPI002458C8CB|nr:HAD family hydrolase [Nocardia cyriacigeorgica]
MTVDQLASWAEGGARAAIREFVARVCDPGSPDHVEPVARIAVFDNDGTLWCERPMQPQLDFTVRRLAEMARDDPSLRSQQPWLAAYAGDLEWMNQALIEHYRGDDTNLTVLIDGMSRAFGDLTVEDYQRRVEDFFDTADHPSLPRPYRDCGYTPMAELMGYLTAHGFTNYIASGGDRDFMRPVADTLYGVPPERVIGSALGLTYRAEQGTSQLLYQPAMDYFDDGPQKPIRIWSRIGRRPILSVGNSNGDVPMLAFSEIPDRPALRILIQHDDAEREFDYVHGAEQALDHAHRQGWTVVSIRDDWHTVFGTGNDATTTATQ